MDLGVIIRKTLVFTGLFAFVYAIFAIIAYFAQSAFQNVAGLNRWMAMIPSVLIIIFTLKPLEQFLINITDRFLYQKKYDYKELLKTFSEEVLTVLDIDKLTELTTGKLADIMKLESCRFELADERSIQGAPAPYQKIGQELHIPLVMQDRSLGTLILGKKKSDEDFTKDDLGIILPLSKALSIAIANAKLFEELTRTQQEVAQKEKMATIGTLAAGMAHEIRNPIMTIRTFADFLPARAGDPAFMKKFERLIPQEIERVDMVARSLLEFSGAESGERKEEFDIFETVKVVLALLEPQYRFLGITTTFAALGRTAGMLHKHQVQDALFNIMKYVFQETPARSAVSVFVAGDDSGIQVTVRDKDLVMKDSVIKDVFDPGSQLSKEKRGFGLGLFIAKELIERGGGVFVIASEKERGTEVRARFSIS